MLKKLYNSNLAVRLPCTKLHGHMDTSIPKTVIMEMLNSL